MGGVWVGAGMWLGGMVNGVLGGILGGVLGGLPFGGVLSGLASAYVVGMIGARFTRNAGLMAAGAFAGTAMSALSGILGGVGSAVSSITSTGPKPETITTGETPKQSSALGVGRSNVVQMPTRR